MCILYIYIYVCIIMFLFAYRHRCIYIYIYIYGGRESERKRERTPGLQSTLKSDQIGPRAQIGPHIMRDASQNYARRTSLEGLPFWSSHLLGQGTTGSRIVWSPDRNPATWHVNYWLDWLLQPRCGFAYIYIYIYTFVHTHIYTHIYIYIYI